MISGNGVYDYFSSNIFNANTNSVFADDIRLNAEYYEEGKSLELNIDLEFVPLSSLAEVVFPGIFKRYLVENIKFGTRFLTTSDMMMIEPDSDKILSEQLTPNIDIYRISEHTLLVSRSGTIGNTIYVDDRIKNFALTEDALRVKPFDTKNIGFLYFYFISEYGNNTITGKKSGAVIDHIYEDDLLKLAVPKLKNESIDELFEHYLSVKLNRENADLLIKEARTLVLLYNNLPSLSGVESDDIDLAMQSLTRSTRLTEFTDDFRLDAHFYNPLAKLTIDNIQKFAANYCELKNDIVDKVFYLNRFKRVFVDKGFGIPYMAGKDIIRTRPTDVSYLSYTETQGLDDYKLKTGWILMSCSGTIGRTCYIHKNYEDWVGTHDLIRIVCNDSFDSGYLYAFLSSDYGYNQVLRYKHGAVIDHLTPEQVEKVFIPLPSEQQQKEIGDLIRQAYDLRAEAIRIEDQAIEIITKTLTKE